MSEEVYDEKFQDQEAGKQIDSKSDAESDEQESIIEQMHPLKKATFKEIFPVLGIILEREQDEELIRSLDSESGSALSPGSADRYRGQSQSNRGK